MKLYWRYKKDGKWTWKPAGKQQVHEFIWKLKPDTEFKVVEEEE